MFALHLIDDYVRVYLNNFKVHLAYFQLLFFALTSNIVMRMHLHMCFGICLTFSLG